MPVLNKDHIDLFYEQGYFVLHHFFPESACRFLSTSFDKLLRISQRIFPFQNEFVYTVQGDLQRVIWAGSLEKRLLNAGKDKRLTRVVSEILDSKTLIHLLNQAHFKCPYTSDFYPLHQESMHRRYGTEEWTDVNGKGSYVQSVLAISTIRKENGALLFIPQSAKLGHLNLPYEDGVQTRTDLCKVEDAVTLEMSPGSMVFFGPYTIHGSLPNTSSHVQKLLINGYALPEANKKIYLGSGKGKRIFVR